MFSWAPHGVPYSNSGSEIVAPQTLCYPAAAHLEATDFLFAPDRDCDSILDAAPRARQSRSIVACDFKRSLKNMVSGPSVRGLGLFMLGVLILYPLANAQEQQPLYLMPVPSSVQIGTGRLLVDSKFSVGSTGYTESRLDRAIERFLRQLSRRTAIPLSGKPGAPAKAILVIHTDHGGKEIQEVGEDESYVLEVSTSGAKLSAPS